MARWFMWNKKLPWQAMAAGITLLSGGVGIVAFGWLGSQDASGCQPAFRFAASDSTRLYCAQLSAEKDTEADLTEAIELVGGIPSDSPLYPERERLTQRWSLRLLEFGEVTFQQGDLDAAIATARRVPPGAAYETAQEQIDKWQSIWSKAEDIASEIESEMEQENWRPAFNLARKLITVGNEYWATTRYQEFVEQIQATKEDKNRQAKASGDQPKRERDGLRIFPTPTDALSRWQQEQEQEAIAQLDKARRLANTGDPQGLQAGIESAQQVLYGTSQYQEAQRLVEDWRRQMEIMEDRPYLDRAIQLANRGDAAALQAAIGEASNVSFGRALYQEAQAKIGQWTERIQQIHVQSFPEQVPAARQTSEIDYRIPNVDPSSTSGR